MVKNDAETLREQFLLNPHIAFLNHGSFGATAKPVLDEYFNWIKKFESNPVEYHGRKLATLMQRARQDLSSYLSVNPDDILFTTNATVALNIVARSMCDRMPLGPGDEVLMSDHEYGACEKMWEFLRRKYGFSVVIVEIPTRSFTSEEVVEAFVAKFTPKTKVLFFSHITSPTAMWLPASALIQACREHGIISLVDGAHAIGQVPLDLTSLDPDFYSSNLHKWLCAPKGSAFLYARKGVQELLEPLVVSWGWEPEEPTDSLFVSHHEIGGTREMAAPLSTAAAISFQEEYRWSEVRKRAFDLVEEIRFELQRHFNFDPIGLNDPKEPLQMVSFLLPDGVDQLALQKKLFNEFNVEVPTFKWGDRTTFRASIQGYNGRSDVDRLFDGLRKILYRK